MNLKVQARPLKILFADDDADDRFIFGTILTKISIPTLLNTVTDGAELMAYLINHATQLPDLIFLDLAMPHKTGYECLIEIKENNNLRDIPVIVLSTPYTKDISYVLEMTDKLLKLGAKNVICKETNVDKYRESIQTILTQPF